MIINDTYIYEITEIHIDRNGKEPIEYYQLRIKHRSHKNTIVVFTHCIRRTTPNAFETLTKLAYTMKKLHY